ncbi:hypothetical protein [Allorhizocola rhizosphaerae]|uniref:hypothetical protein n=1 Tax=Allorhizocola rhizosphaerae TaxID=1872709 RepID=UPI000E3BD265|nr:hypothetical protein [Allorhizocola rhizosphaerae]
MSDMLRRQLAALADQANSADLYDRVIAGSRRRARRVHAASTASAAVALAAVVFGVTQMRTGGVPLEIGPSALDPTPTLTPTATAVPSQTPDASPSHVATGPSSIDLRNAKLEVVIPAGRGVCQFTDGVGTVEINTIYDARLISSAVFPDRGIAAALIEVRAGAGSPLRRIHLYPLPDTTKNATLLVDQPYTEFLDATKIEAVGSELHVTINGQIKRYRID